MEPIGVAVLEARISHLAYSSEIASAMLRETDRQRRGCRPTHDRERGGEHR